MSRSRLRSKDGRGLETCAQQASESGGLRRTGTHFRGAKGDSEAWLEAGAQQDSGNLRSGEGRGLETHSQPEDGSAGDKVVLFMAAVAGEVIKGFHVAHEACRILRETRSDFELVVTFDPAGPIDEFTRSVGGARRTNCRGIIVRRISVSCRRLLRMR
jgi:hypothetical protein